MSRSFPMVPLGEILTKSEEWIDLKPDQRYREVTVRLWGKGVVQRREVTGAEITARRRLVVRHQQFILSRIDARNGALGLVPASLDGAVVSNDFPVFTPNRERVLPSYLEWMARTRWFTDLCRQASEGTTNRVRLVAAGFLSTRVPLPPLEEQRRIVARIEDLAARIEHARTLRRQAELGCEALCRSIISDASNGAAIPTPIRELVRMREPDVAVSRHETYSFAGVYCFGGGVFAGRRRSGMEFAYDRLTRLRTGDFVYPKLMAWEGALGIVPPECDGLVVSPEFPVFEIDQRRVLPETLDVYFRTPAVWPMLSRASTGTNVRRRRLHPADFLALEIRLPPMAVQQTLRQVRAKVDVVRRWQAETAAELDALLPSVLDRAFRGEV